MHTRHDVVLINMPFGYFLTPSLGLGLLKAALAQIGIPAKTFYFNIRFAELLGEQAYSRMYDGTYTEHLAGEWTFSNALFQHQSDADVALYVNGILRGEALGPYDNCSYQESALEEIVNAISAARERVEGFLEECLGVVVNCQPKVVGFTSLFHQHVASLSLAKRIKGRLPETFIVFGGPNCEGAMGQETLRQFDFVDAVVSGEGEFVFTEMVRRILDHKPLPHLEGVFSRDHSGLRVMHQPLKSTPVVKNLDTLPIPDYDDYFEQLDNSPLNLSRKPSLLFETSRGCWWGEKHHCTFCGLNGGTMAYRSKSAERALDELVYLTERYPGCAVNVVDNILDMNYFKDFIPLLAERKQKFNLFYEVKANLKKEQLRLLREAGIGSIQPGIESFSDNVLQIMRKGVSPLQNIQLIKWCKALGLKVYYHLLWGFPGETSEDYLEMARLLPLLTHLPPPLGSGILRIDRFSPNFDQAEQLGFNNLSPHPAYSYVYPLGLEALSNLAYFFTFEYRTPQNVAEYVKPLADEIERWKQYHDESDLFWVEKGKNLLIWDFRPVAKETLTVLTGSQKFSYMACDRIMTVRQILDLWGKDSEVPLGQSDVCKTLETLTSLGLMIKHKDSYLALASPLSS